MAAKRAQQTNAFGSTKFAAISLDDKLKKQFLAWWEAQSPEIETMMVTLNTDGWKTSSSWDANNDCFIVSATQRNEKDQNYDVCVTSRSDNLFQAYGLCAFKIFVLFENAKIPTEAPKNNWG